MLWANKEVSWRTVQQTTDRGIWVLINFQITMSFFDHYIYAVPMMMCSSACFARPQSCFGRSSNGMCACMYTVYEYLSNSCWQFLYFVACMMQNFRLTAHFMSVYFMMMVLKFKSRVINWSVWWGLFVNNEGNLFRWFDKVSESLSFSPKLFICRLHESIYLCISLEENY